MQNRTRSSADDDAHNAAAPAAAVEDKSDVDVAVAPVPELLCVEMFEMQYAVEDATVAEFPFLPVLDIIKAIGEIMQDDVIIDVNEENDFPPPVQDKRQQKETISDNFVESRVELAMENGKKAKARDEVLAKLVQGDGLISLSTASCNAVAGGGGRLKNVLDKGTHCPNALVEVFSRLVPDGGAGNLQFSVGEVLPNTQGSAGILGFTLSKQDNFEILVHMYQHIAATNELTQIVISVVNLLEMVTGVGVEGKRERFDNCEVFATTFKPFMKKYKYVVLRNSSRVAQKKAFINVTGAEGTPVATAALPQAIPVRTVYIIYCAVL